VKKLLEQMAVPNAQQQRWLIERVEHPVLPLALACDATGALCAVALHADEAVLRRCADAAGVDRLESRSGAASEAHEQLQAFLAGERTHFKLCLNLHGTPFEKKVWEAVARIEWGQTRSYGQLADQLGRSGAARAIGRANARNPVPLVVPCHRVIGSDGSLTGFAGGVEAKAWLLEREAVQGRLFDAVEVVSA
jgi:methylated-DNA-[protein]-cysteine S-methyltransferase